MFWQLYDIATQVAKGRTDLLRRQAVKSNSATVTVPELQFAIPPGTQKGVITTVEGLLTDASTGLRCMADPFAQSRLSQPICVRVSMSCQVYRGF